MHARRPCNDGVDFSLPEQCNDARNRNLVLADTLTLGVQLVADLRPKRVSIAMHISAYILRLRLGWRVVAWETTRSFLGFSNMFRGMDRMHYERGITDNRVGSSASSFAAHARRLFVPFDFGSSKSLASATSKREEGT